MKILIAASACHPTAGSEAYVGWQAVSQLRHDHDLWVLTSGWCREGIEEFLSKNQGWTNVRFVYVDRPLPNHPNRLLARIFSWTRYRTWCRLAEEEGRRLVREVQFDLAHHVTYATWRMGSPLASLGIPWIWGPIGGGEVFPAALIRVLSPVSALFEIFRGFSTVIARRSSAVQIATKTVAMVLPNNPETEKLVIGLGVSKERIRSLSQSFLPEERMERLRRTDFISPRECGLLRCVAGGNLEGRKGVAIALKALADVSQMGIPFSYTYLGRGPELEHLKTLAVRLGIQNKVRFLDSLSGADYVEALRSHHVYLLPSLREGVPVTQMEAMAAGCVPIVADCGGAGPMARAGGSIPVVASSPEAMAREIAQTLIRMWEMPEEWTTLSRQARQAILDRYSAHYYRLEIGRYYGMVAEFSKNG